MKLYHYTKDDILQFTNSREGEVKIGDRIQIASLDQLHKFQPSFVLLGVPEDIGVRANYGLGGTDTLWDDFLSAFLNLQNNQNLHAADIILLGKADIDLEPTRTLSVPALRGMVSLLDEFLFPVLMGIYTAGHTPIVIGGGHNNAYPIIKATYHKAQKAIRVMNMDLHHDYRALEGRHSGNGFSYAMRDGLLEAYLMWGLSKFYTQQNFLDEWAKNDKLFAVFYETLISSEFSENLKMLKQYIETVSDSKFGLEVDMDSIEGMLSSAMTPSGHNPKEIRAYVSLAAEYKPWYLHICEGASRRRDGQTHPTVAKMAALLVADFIYNYKNPQMSL